MRRRVDKSDRRVEKMDGGTGKVGHNRSLRRRRAFKSLLWTTGILVLLVAAVVIVNAVICRKVEGALRNLPATLTVHYSSLRANILTGLLEMRDIDARYMPAPGQAHEVSVHDLRINGFSVFGWLRSHRVRINRIHADSITIKVDEDLLEQDSTPGRLTLPAVDGMVGRIDLQGIRVRGMRKGKNSFSLEGDCQLDSVTRDTVGALRLALSRVTSVIPGMDESIDCRDVELSSRDSSLHVDSLRLRPDLDPETIGRLKGHQVDVLRLQLADIRMTGLDVAGLLKHRLHADQIRLGGGKVYAFRDRRLPLKPGDKAMPAAALESLDMDLRVKRLLLEKTRFEYREFPKEGSKIGELVIDDFHGSVEPLLNRPRAGDPAFMTVKTAGSLMGSGTVAATTLMPFRRDSPYRVDGAFHNLDVTSLNDPAENLGQLRLESGMLNMLDFHFEMSDERSTGKIIGEYHNLVADKLKIKGGALKTAKFKSFMLKKLIIPKNKDKSLPVSKRTGKVNYKRDKQRYFSYYLLHSLLVGVKSSFKLGFLLPG